MSDRAQSASEAVQRLSRRDSTFKHIDLIGKHLTDAELAELADCLLAHPDVVTTVNLGGNRLTGETGAKLAQYLATSSTIKMLNLADNQFGEVTYLALAAALRVNTSLKFLYLNGNQAVDETRIDAAFAEALRLNPYRPAAFIFERLFAASSSGRSTGHPSLLALLTSDRSHWVGVVRTS